MLFEKRQNRPTRLPLLTVYAQALLYYEQIYTWVIIPFQLLILIFKYNALIYESLTIGLEITLLAVGFLLNAIRLSSGRQGLKGRSYFRMAIYLILSIILIPGEVYLLQLQEWILWL